MAFRLDRERSIAEIAALANMPVRTMRRRLIALHRAHGNLLVNVGTGAKPVYRLTLGALKRIAPHLFLEQSASRQEIQQLQATVKEHEEMLRALAARVRSLGRLVRERAVSEDRARWRVAS